MNIRLLISLFKRTATNVPLINMNDNPNGDGRLTPELFVPLQRSGR